MNQKQYAAKVAHLVVGVTRGILIGKNLTLRQVLKEALA